ncbi:MAG: TolC family protein [Acidobacteria bacterium]|nr:MAG: TolC family protein [Acidobacteriota bacterium]
MIKPVWRKVGACETLLFLSFFSSRLGAQQPDARVLTLNAAIEYAKQHSPLLAATRQGVVTQKAVVAAAKAERLPQVDVGAAMLGSNQAAESGLAFPLTPLVQMPSQPFADGHLVGIATATLPIYTGGRIRSAQQVAEAERYMAQTNVRDVESNLVFEVSTTYARLVETDRDVQAAQESVKALTESRRDMAEGLKVGKVARVDLLKIDTRLADVEARLIDLRNERQVLAGQLNALMGREIDTPVVTETTLPHPEVTISSDDATRAAAAANPQYQIAEARVEVAQNSLKAAKSELRPTFSLSTAFYDHSPDPFSAYRGGAIAGFTFSYPIFDRQLKHRVAEAKSRELEARSKAEQERLDAIERARTAWLQVRDAEARIRATQSSIADARETLRIEQLMVRYGRDRIEHLLDAQAALLTSEADYYRALADSTVATAALNRETGQ